MKTFGVIIFTRKLFGVIIPSFGVTIPWYKGVMGPGLAASVLIASLTVVPPSFDGVIYPSRSICAADGVLFPC